MRPGEMKLSVTPIDPGRFTEAQIALGIETIWPEVRPTADEVSDFVRHNPGTWTRACLGQLDGFRWAWSPYSKRFVGRYSDGSA